MIRAVLAGWILAVSCAAHAACDESSTTADLNDAQARFRAAWEDLDEIGVASAVAAADRAVVCLDEPFQPQDVVPYFQIRGLSAFLRDDLLLATGEFTAATEILPSMKLPSAVAMEGDDWHALYTKLQGRDATERVALPSPVDGWIQVDGTRAEDRPTARPWIFQEFDSQGGVVQTARVSIGDAPPRYDRGQAQDLATSNDPDPVASGNRSRRSLVLLGGGIGAAAAGGASLAIADKIRRNYRTTELESDASILKVNNGAYGVAGWGGVLAGAGLGVSAVIVGEW